MQIGALSGVAGRSVGLASGLVETMREIGGAVGIAAVSTVLVARTRDAIEITDPAARASAAFDGFQSAFVVTVVLATLGVLVAVIAFPRVPRDVPVLSGDEELAVIEPGSGQVAALGAAGADPTSS